MKIKQLRGVLERFSSMYDAGGADDRSRALRSLADSLAQHDAKTVASMLKEHKKRQIEAQNQCSGA